MKRTNAIQRASHGNELEQSPSTTPLLNKEDYHSDSVLSAIQPKRSAPKLVHPLRSKQHSRIAKLIPRKFKSKYRRKPKSRRRDGKSWRVAIYARYSAIDLDAFCKSLQRIDGHDTSFAVSMSDAGVPTESFHPIDASWNTTLLGEVVAMSKSHSVMFEQPSPVTPTTSPHRTRANTADCEVGVSPIVKVNRLGINTILEDGSNADGDDEDEQLDPWHVSNVANEEELSSRADAHVFGFGCIVCWNFPSRESERRFVEGFRPFSEDTVSAEARENAEDDMDFFYGSRSSVKNDEIELESSDWLEKLAVSFALAQSSLLSVYESRVDETISRTEHVPRELARSGTIKMTQKSISQEVGRLFIERNSINLESDILDTPEYFWENDEWEHVYEKMCEYLEQEKRIEILNRRLDCIGELLDVLNTQIENQHASKLEWIIIWLILIEVVIQVVWNVLIKDILQLF